MVERFKLLIERNKFIANILRKIYRNTILKYLHYKQNKNFNKNAKYVMHKIDEVFKELGIQYWLEYGTLLGAYREGAFIRHDLDIDLGLFLDDYSEEIDKVFKKHGFKLKRTILVDDGKYGREDTYKLLNISIDLFYFTKYNNTKMYVHDFKNEDGKSWTKTIRDNGGLIVRERYFENYGFTTIRFLDSYFPVPANTDKHLASVYGKDFMTPNPKWNPYHKPKNVKILKDKIGKVISYD
jgi:phosphorylcholine metabolism protein LicD